MRPLHATLMWFGLREDKGLLPPPSEGGPASARQPGPSWPAVVVGAVALGLLTGFASSHIERAQLRAGDDLAFERILDDPLHIVHRRALLGGEVRTYYSPRTDAVAVAVEGLSAPTPDAELVATVNCPGGRVNLGAMGERFFDSTTVHQFILKAVGQCDSLTFRSGLPVGNDSLEVEVPIGARIKPGTALV